jgi:CheY-like chemotaxis protein
MKLWSLKKKHILIVDDFPGMRSMLRNMLSGYRPESITDASNGEQAFELISENNYDVILCDYNLGDGKDGQQVLEEAKEKDLLPYSTIYIMTTAENTSEMVMGAVEYIPDDYLSKPFTKEVLISRLRNLVEKKENLKQISLATQQRDYVSAIELCQKLLRKNPTNRYALLKIQADLLIKINDYDNAENIVRAILNEREVPWALLFLGQINFFRKKFDDAKYIFEDLAEDNPNYLPAHDWLSKVYKATGDLENSQNALLKAVERSPKAIKRQQTLANVAFENKDFDVSETAYKKIVRTGKYSCYLTPDDYKGLANVYIQKGMNTEALNTVNSMKESFGQADTENNMKTLVNEAFIYNEMLNVEKTQSIIENIMSIFNVTPGAMHSSDAIDTATICFSHDMTDYGNLLIQHAIRNNHDNEDAINNITNKLSSIGLSGEMIDTLMKTRDEVVDLNNRGVKLATSGNIKESISLFIQAASGMSENTVINLNTAQSLIMHMKESGATDDLIRETKKYLDRVIFEGKPSDKYRMLTAAYLALKKSIDNTPTKG